jgi:hypothetical protein
MACTHDLRVTFLRGLREMLLEMARVTVEWEPLYEKTDESDVLKNGGATALTKINRQNTLMVENGIPSSFLKYSLRLILLFINTYVSRHILVVDTPVLAKINMGRRE